MLASALVPYTYLSHKKLKWHPWLGRTIYFYIQSCWYQWWSFYTLDQLLRFLLLASPISNKIEGSSNKIHTLVPRSSLCNHSLSSYFHQCLCINMKADVLVSALVVLYSYVKYVSIYLVSLEYQDRGRWTLSQLCQLIINRLVSY